MVEVRGVGASILPRKADSPRQQDHEQGQRAPTPIIAAFLDFLEDYLKAQAGTHSPSAK
jgi:hypothetical protein